MGSFRKAWQLIGYKLTSNIMTMKSAKRSPLALAVLGMLMQGPLHPYGMQRLIKERGKDEVINVTQRTSLYQTIQRLEREGLVRPQMTARDEGRPERTVYEITDAGREIALLWMRQMLSTLTREYPEFPAAVSFLPLLAPTDALRQLALRAEAIEAEIRRIDEGLQAAAAVPRLFLLESEYARALLVAEQSWTNAVVEDLRTKRITWNKAWLRQVAAQFPVDLQSEKD